MLIRPQPEVCTLAKFSCKFKFRRFPVSDPQNPLEFLPSPGPGQPPENQPQLPPLPVSGENPPWGFLEIIGIIAVGVVSLALGVLLVLTLAHKYLYPNLPLLAAAQEHPLLLIAAQAISYLGIVAFMAFLVKRAAGSFGLGIRWNWPNNPWGYLLGGVGLSLGLQLLGHFLPIPKELPMDKFFRTPLDAWILALFGMFIAPLMEELFFRGFLYPVLAKWFGVVASIIITALGFGLVHASQLGSAWGPVLIIFLVGIVLTTVRAKTKSVAAGWLMHFAYNATIFGLMFIATSGFRHMERISQ
jgi:membrane protease YdiL (CAAX protease family)